MNENVFVEILDWLTSVEGGAFIVVSWGLSWALEGITWWDGLTSKLRSLIILVVSILLGLLTVWFKTMPGVLATVEPYANTVVYIVLAWLATQVAHKGDKLVEVLKALAPKRG